MGGVGGSGGAWPKLRAAVRANATEPNAAEECIVPPSYNVYSAVVYSVAGAKASSTFPGMPLRTPTQPDGTNSIPPATTGPADPMDPPFAGTPFTVSNGRTVSNCQSTLPSAVDSARSMPSQLPEKMRPGLVLSGPSWPLCE